MSGNFPLFFNEKNTTPSIMRLKGRGKVEIKDYYDVNDKFLFGDPLVTNAKVYNLSSSIKASKYPMATDTSKCTDEITKRTIALGNAKVGSGHDCACKGIQVVFDLTWTVKASVQLQRYHFIDFISSQSQMHRIAKFDLEPQYIKYVDKKIIERIEELKRDYLNETNPELKKEKYLILLYSNPSGFRLTAKMTTNYLQLKTIYNQRCKVPHKLPEWIAFGEWMETELPFFKELCLDGLNEKGE